MLRIPRSKYLGLRFHHHRWHLGPREWLLLFLCCASSFRQAQTFHQDTMPPGSPWTFQPPSSINIEHHTVTFTILSQFFIRCMLNMSKPSWSALLNRQTDRLKSQQLSDLNIFYSYHPIQNHTSISVYQSQFCLTSLHVPRSTAKSHCYVSNNFSQFVYLFFNFYENPLQVSVGKYSQNFSKLLWL